MRIAIIGSGIAGLYLGYQLKKGPWCETWNYLYYHFLIDHREILKKNYSTANMIYHLDKKSESEKEEIVRESNSFANEISSI